MIQEKFNLVKAAVLRLAKAGNACESEYSAAANSDSIDSLMAVITKNFCWSARNGLLEPELLESIGDEVLCRHGVYRAGKHEIFGSSSATVETFGSSSATVETLDSSSVRDLTKNVVHLKKDRWTIVLH